MKVEEHSISGALKYKEKNNNFLKIDLLHQPGYLQKENERVIKLIHQKMYPLNHSQRASLIFPKLKQKYDNNFPQVGKQNKNYIEITLQDDQQNKLLTKHRTDLEDEHYFKGKFSKKKLTQKLKTGKDNQLQQSKNEQFQKINKCSSSQVQLIDRCLMQQKIPKNRLFDQSQANSIFFQNEGQRILHQSFHHFNFLKKMKEDIKKQKDQYFKNAHLTQIFQNNNGARKENYSIQYLIKSIQNKTIKNGQNISPYEIQSPNKLRQFVSLFEKKKRNLLLWEQLELAEPGLEKQKSTGEQLKSSHHIRSKNRHKTIIEEQSDINLQNILSAKYRIKNNHKKMIQLAKAKAV